MIHRGDLFDVLPTLSEASIDACVTDPPYGIGFMGKQWDTFTPGGVAQPERYERPIESENPNLRGRRRSPAVSPSQIPYDRTLRGQREFQAWTAKWAAEVLRVLKPGAHLLVCGAPRSGHRMIAGVEDAGFEIRDCVAWVFGQGFPKSRNLGDGWGTALKPAYEPIVVARKPFKGSVEKNHAMRGTGGLNIDACRIGLSRPAMATVNEGAAREFLRAEGRTVVGMVEEGRWPANVALDETAAGTLDEQSGELVSGGTPFARSGLGYSGKAHGQPEVAGNNGDRGGASRFFYVAKPSRAERDLGCWGRARNGHPTVKPVDLMRWLVRLVTPPGGTVLDPFTGSGTTGMACAYEGLTFIGIEREAEYVEIAERRIAACLPLLSEPSGEGDLFSGGGQ